MPTTESFSQQSALPNNQSMSEALNGASSTFLNCGEYAAATLVFVYVSALSRM